MPGPSIASTLSRSASDLTADPRGWAKPQGKPVPAACQAHQEMGQTPQRSSRLSDLGPEDRKFSPFQPGEARGSPRTQSRGRGQSAVSSSRGASSRGLPLSNPMGPFDSSPPTLSMFNPHLGSFRCRFSTHVDSLLPEQRNTPLLPTAPGYPTWGWPGSPLCPEASVRTPLFNVNPAPPGHTCSRRSPCRQGTMAQRHGSACPVPCPEPLECPILPVLTAPGGQRPA